MLKKTIKYTNFNGEEESEDFFFHLSKAELVEMELSHKGGLVEALQKIIDAEDGAAIIREFKSIILGSYGKKSLDGKRFMKTQEIRDEFESSEAYSTLFMELVTDTDAAIEFINGVVPAGLAEEAAKIAAAHKEDPVEEIKVLESVAPQIETEEPTAPRAVTKEELEHMSREQFEDLQREISAGRAVIVGT